MRPQARVFRYQPYCLGSPIDAIVRADQIPEPALRAKDWWQITIGG